MLLCCPANLPGKPVSNGWYSPLPSAELALHTGVEFDELQGPEQTAALANMAVFARVEPSHKQRLVELLKMQVPLRYMCAFLGEPPA